MCNKDNSYVELIDESGLHLGDRIKGSQYLRSFCLICKTPIRTTSEHLFSGICEECSKNYQQAPNIIVGEYRKGLQHLKDYDDKQE